MASGDDALAVGGGNGPGTGAAATNDGAIAVGVLSVASGVGSIAIGTPFGTGTAPVAAGDNSIAMGSNASTAAGATNAMALGTGASAGFANSVAIGPGATTTRANQAVLGTAAATYTLPGITSAASLAAQAPNSKFVTTDAAGNLATSSFGPSDIANLQSDVFSLRADLDQTRKRAYEGTAIAIALGGGTLPDNKRFALSANWGGFRGENAAGVTGLLRVTDNLVINGGVGFGFSEGGVGGRVGATLAW